MIWWIMLLLVPASLVLGYLFRAPPLWVFGTAVLAIVPLANWVRRATEQVARRAGPAVGGLLNVTFGNAPELILALFVLMAGEPRVVKAQITGSIIGNGLLGAGLAILVACWDRERVRFQRRQAGRLSSLLVLAMIALLVPALFRHAESNRYGVLQVETRVERVSLAASVVLVLVYVANLVYTLRSRSSSVVSESSRDNRGSSDAWPLWGSIGVLLAGTAGTALESDLVSHSLGAAAGQLGFSRFFMGIVPLALIGNAAEYVSAIYFARQARMDLVLSITIGSSIQVALLVAPLLVLLSFVLGKPMDLAFTNPLELVAFAGAALAVNAIAQDGEATWLEGVLLLAVYALLGIAFFYSQS